MDSKILVFIPMYNCEKQIPRVLEKFSPEIQKMFSEILVIDNHSMDKSVEEAQKALKKLIFVKTSLIQNKENFSLGGSHKVAFNYAIKNNFDYCLVLHGDDQGSVVDIVPFLLNGEYQKYDSFLGARFGKGTQLIGYSKFRTLGNEIFNWFFSLITRRHVFDMGSGQNLYKVDYLKDRFYLYFPNDLTFNVYLLLYGIWTESKFKFFPLTWREDDQVSNAKVFRQGIKILGLLCKYIISKKKIFSRDPNLYSKIKYDFNTIFSNGQNA